MDGAQETAQAGGARVGAGRPSERARPRDGGQRPRRSAAASPTSIPTGAGAAPKLTREWPAQAGRRVVGSVWAVRFQGGAGLGGGDRDRFYFLDPVGTITHQQCPVRAGELHRHWYYRPAPRPFGERAGAPAKGAGRLRTRKRRFPETRGVMIDPFLYKRGRFDPPVMGKGYGPQLPLTSKETGAEACG